MNDQGQVDRYLCFSLGAEKFALPLLKVREVIAPPLITSIPQAPGYCLGYMSLRGEIITVLDLRKRIGMKAANGPELATIICEVGGGNVGLVVDEINQVLSPRAPDVAAKPEGAAGPFARSVTGVFRADQELILFLDIEQALSDVPLQTILAPPAA